MIMSVYAYKIKESMQHFSLQSNKITTLQLIDKDFDNFALSINKFINYETVYMQEEKFRQTLQDLRNDLQRYNPDTLLLLDNIQNSFQKKVEDLEYFKAQNSALINSSHFLFDLHTTISDSPKISFQTKDLTNKILFYVLKYISSDYIDKKHIEKKLSALKNLAKYEKTLYPQTFYSHAKVMLQTLQSLKEVTKEIQTNPLYKQIETLKLHITQDYEKNLQYQTWIVNIFFIFTIFILFVLIVSHLASSKTKKELLSFKYAIEHSDNIIIMTDLDRNIVYVNETFEKATGYKAQEVLGKNPNILQSGLQSEETYKELNEKISKGQRWEGQFINKRKDGTLLYEKASIVPVFLQGKLVNYLALKLDITEYAQKNKQLAQAAAVFDNTEEAITIADAEGKVISVNRAFTDIYQYTLDEIKGKTLSFL
jgi:PAS domain S-box-containing protein